MTPQELKNSILKLAIQGKLVEQRPEEGTGEELYQQLSAHHVSLKQSKDELNLSSMNFDIPENWVWIELNQLFDFVDYRGKTPNKISEGVFLITASNIKNGYMDYTRKEFISYNEYLDRQSRGVTKKGDLLFTTEAPMGNAALCDLDECSCGQRIITFKAYQEKTVIPQLFVYFILSPQFQQQLLDNCTGTTAKGIKAEKLKHFLIPLPPLAEQKRIVAKIEEILPYIDRYEQAWSKLEEFNKRFPSDMQKSILQMAIQGKLVEQRPEEGTGEELYQQIQEEKKKLIAEGKIKKEKPLPEITEEEIPFEIPESWKWVKVGNVIDVRDGTHDTPKYVSEGIPLVTSKNLVGGRIDFETTKLISYEDAQAINMRSAVDNGDILFAMIGTIGNPVLVQKDREFSIKNMALFKSINYDLLNMQYFLLFLNQEQSSMKKKASGGVQSFVSLKFLRNYLFPLPPLDEQKRIVAKLEELLPLCERLK